MTKMFALIALAGVSLAIAGCGGEESKPAAPKVAPPTATPGPAAGSDTDPNVDKAPEDKVEEK